MQWRMLFATMIGYTLFYFMRKNFSFAMPGLQQDCGISKSMLGNFLFWGGIVYGLSKFVNGIVGDKVAPRKMLCFGLLACTLVSVAFGFAAAIGFTMAICVFAGVRERLNFADPPKAFRGFPLLLISAGLAAMAFSGFSGMKF